MLRSRGMKVTGDLSLSKVQAFSKEEDVIQFSENFMCFRETHSPPTWPLHMQKIEHLGLSITVKMELKKGASEVGMRKGALE